MRRLKLVAVSLFLLLYFVSSFLTTQLLVGRVVRHVMLVASGSHDEIVQNRKAIGDSNYTRYREAKKAGIDYRFGSIVSFSLPSLSGRCDPIPQQLDWESHSLHTSAVRAPPLFT